MSATTSENAQTLPQQRATILTVSGPLTHLEHFLKAQPKALGVVQVMTGVMTLLLGIVHGFSSDFTLSFNIGIMYWGSIIYIIAGSLTVAAEKKLYHCMVNASLGMNVVSAITAGFSIFFSAIDISQSGYYMDNCMASKLGISGILLVLSILQLITSICVSAFACQASCVCHSQGVVASVNQQFFSLPVPLTNLSIIGDYANMNNEQRERDPAPTPTEKTDPGLENVYEQPTYTSILDM